MAKLEDGTIAGSILTYIQAFKNVMEFTGATVEDAVKMTSGNQAKDLIIRALLQQEKMQTWLY